jgi:hypothetical protein
VIRLCLMFACGSVGSDVATQVKRDAGCDVVVAD